MIQRVPININDIIPASKVVLNHQGIPEDAVIPNHISSLFEDAIIVFKEKAKPVAIILTVGSEIVETINDLFTKKDFAPGAMLDSVASMAADKSVEILETYLLNYLSESNLTKNGSIVLGYSPGYCGWDLSGQKKLFQRLNPGEIGITLNESFLMSPLKSVSGVLVYGDKEIHVFESSFTFCSYCKNQTCYDRIEKIYNSG